VGTAVSAFDAKRFPLIAEIGAGEKCDPVRCFKGHFLILLRNARFNKYGKFAASGKFPCLEEICTFPRLRMVLCEPISAVQEKVV
jgi:hypothetical protein